MKTPTLLPYVHLAVYDDNLRGARLTRECQPRRLNFADLAGATAWIEKHKPKLYNLYRIEKVNGTWRTDWELTTEGQCSSTASAS